MVPEIFIRMVGIFSSRLITFLTSLYIASLLSEGEWGRISLIMNYFTIFDARGGSDGLNSLSPNELIDYR